METTTTNDENLPTTEQPTTQPPTTTTLDPICEGQTDTNVSDPLSCDYYYDCDANGIATKKECSPSFLRYHPQWKACVPKFLVKCKLNKKKDKKTKHDAEHENLPSTEQPTTTTLNTICEGQTDTNVSDPLSCDHYYDCDANGIATKKECEPSFARYHPQWKACVPKFLVPCKLNKKKDKKTKHDAEREKDEKQREEERAKDEKEREEERAKDEKEREEEREKDKKQRELEEKEREKRDESKNVEDVKNGKDAKDAEKKKRNDKIREYYKKRNDKIREFYKNKQKKWNDYYKNKYASKKDD